jgi:predicted nucleotide-binding protein
VPDGPRRVFVASSNEGRWIASALFNRLNSRSIHVQLWTSEETFRPSESYLDSLIQIAAESTFAVFVCSADDVLISRDRIAGVPRDNVIFEIGLFMGALGKQNCFCIVPGEREVRLPTDLAGHSHLLFSPTVRFEKDLDELADKLRRLIQKTKARAPDLLPLNPAAPALKKTLRVAGADIPRARVEPLALRKRKKRN